jgi:hypothetical protein
MIKGNEKRKEERKEGGKNKITHLENRTVYFIEAWAHFIIHVYSKIG